MSFSLILDPLITFRLQSLGTDVLTTNTDVAGSKTCGHDGVVDAVDVEVVVDDE